MHFLQTKPWQEFQDQLGRTTFREQGDGWEYMAVLERGTGNTRLYCPYGPYAETEEAFEAALASLAKLGKAHGVTFVRVEPPEAERAQYLKQQGWKKVTYQSLNPEHSRVIDLTLPEDELVAQMAQPVRNCYRNYQKKGVSVEKSTDPQDIEKFLTLIHEVSARTGMRPHSDNYFRTQSQALLPADAGTLWCASYENDIIAAALLYDSDDTRYYAHAAASSLPDYRKLNAGTAIVAEAIVDAKRHGKKTFDLYGIAPEGASSDHPWAGFTKFKRSFGGKDVSFGGSWDLSLKPLAYWMYRTYQSLR